MATGSSVSCSTVFAPGYYKPIHKQKEQNKRARKPTYSYVNEFSPGSIILTPI